MMNSEPLKNYFNTISNHYIVNEYASFYITSYLRKKLVNKIPTYNNKHVLDLMSGQGENIKYIKKFNEATKITTIDYSKKMNEAAKQKLKSRNIKQIEENFFKINCNVKSFDVILCSFGIKTIDSKNKKDFSLRISSLLKPKGEVLLLEMVKPKNKLLSKIMRFYLKKCVPKIFGSQFKLLYNFTKEYKNMNSLRNSFLDNNLSIIEHQRILDSFEIIHAKKIN